MYWLSQFTRAACFLFSRAQQNQAAKATPAYMSSLASRFLRRCARSEAGGILRNGRQLSGKWPFGASFQSCKDLLRWALPWKFYAGHALGQIRSNAKCGSWRYVALVRGIRSSAIPDSTELSIWFPRTSLRSTDSKRYWRHFIARLTSNLNGSRCSRSTNGRRRCINRRCCGSYQSFKWVSSRSDQIRPKLAALPYTWNRRLGIEPFSAIQATSTESLWGAGRIFRPPRSSTLICISCSIRSFFETGCWWKKRTRCLDPRPGAPCYLPEYHDDIVALMDECLIKAVECD